ncbi:MAG TPA: hypothetical protein ENG76_04955, partial [Nitrospirae bacterium]|nr:hypothetical protein [Nitrospirota bacterium]
MLYRIVIFLIFTAVGYLLGIKERLIYQGIMWGAGIGLIALIIDYIFSIVGFGTVIGGLLGLSVGLLFAKLIYFPLISIFTNIDGKYMTLVFNVLFGYSGLLLGLRVGKDFTISNLAKAFKSRIEDGHETVIDTSVIIDGRIVEVCETGFFEGSFIIPQFILQELQHIADSSDSLRRARGR